MKISQLIKNIVADADAEYGHSNHINDCISINIFYSLCNGGEFQVCLSRPSQRQLDGGEVDDLSSIKKTENDVWLHTKAPTLLEALTELHQRLANNS